MAARPQVGIGLIIWKDDRVLLVQRRGSHGAGTWSTPGGHLEYGESPEECACREAKEETGVDVTGVTFKALTNDLFTAEGKHYITIWMESTYAGGKPMVNAPDELSQVGWFAWDALPQPLFLPLQNLLDGKSYTRA